MPYEFEPYEVPGLIGGGSGALEWEIYLPQSAGLAALGTPLSANHKLPSFGEPPRILSLMEFNQRDRPTRPPLGSWDTSFHLALGIIRGVMYRNKDSLARARLLTRKAAAPTPFGVKITKVHIPRRQDVVPQGMDPADTAGLVKAEWIDFHPNEKGRGPPERVVLYIHGGAYFLCSRKTHRGLTWRVAKYCRARVLSVDYRLAPEYTFPTPLNDVISAYLSLITPTPGSTDPVYRPEQIVFMGDSAGGGLALSCALWLRDDCRFPMPGGLCLFSPWLDLTHSMPSWRLNNPFDYLPDASSDPKHITTDRSHYYVARNSDLKHPLVSPIFAQENPSRPLPPTLIQCGDAEKLRDESITFTCNIMRDSRIQLEMYQDMVHVFQMWAGVEEISKVALRRAGEWVVRNIHGGDGVDGWGELPDSPVSPRSVLNGEVYQTQVVGVNGTIGTTPPPPPTPDSEKISLAWPTDRVVRIAKPDRHGAWAVLPVHNPMRIVDEAWEILKERGQWEGTKKRGRPVPSRGLSHFLAPMFVINQEAKVKDELDQLAIQVNPNVAKEESDSEM
ncbi:hypothetical protein HDV00_006800 [Rhizophlyctis rosea]|nr:hypothetical protein HDV00_006800 [Rhizophlyctis rosea]